MKIVNNTELTNAEELAKATLRNYKQIGDMEIDGKLILDKIFKLIDCGCTFEEFFFNANEDRWHLEINNLKIEYSVSESELYITIDNLVKNCIKLDFGEAVQIWTKVSSYRRWHFLNT